MVGSNDDDWWLDDPTCDYTQANQKIFQSRHQAHQHAQTALARFGADGRSGGAPDASFAGTTVPQQSSRDASPPEGNNPNPMMRNVAPLSMRVVPEPTVGGYRQTVVREEEEEVVVQLGFRDASGASSSANQPLYGTRQLGLQLPTNNGAPAPRSQTATTPYSSVQPLRSSPFFEYANDPLPGVYGTLQRDPSVEPCPRFISQEDMMGLKDPDALSETLQKIQSYYGYHPVMSEALRVLDRLNEPVELKSEWEKSSGIRQRRTTLAKNETTIRWPSEYNAEATMVAKQKAPDVPVPIPLPLEAATSAADPPRSFAEIASEQLGPRRPNFLAEAAEVVQQQQPHFHSLIFPPPRVLRAFEEENAKRPTQPPPVPLPVELPATRSVFAAASESLAVALPLLPAEPATGMQQWQAGASSGQPAPQHVPAPPDHTPPPPSIQAAYVNASTPNDVEQPVSQQPAPGGGTTIAVSDTGGPPPVVEPPPPVVDVPRPVAAEATPSSDLQVEDEYELRRRRAVEKLKTVFFNPNVSNIVAGSPSSVAVQEQGKRCSPAVTTSDLTSSAAAPEGVDEYEARRCRAVEKLKTQFFNSNRVANVTPGPSPAVPAATAVPDNTDEYEVRRLAAVERLKGMMRLPSQAASLVAAVEPRHPPSPSLATTTSTSLPSPSPSPQQPVRY